MDSGFPNFEGSVVPENEESSQSRIENVLERPSGSNNFYVANNNIPFQQSFPSNPNLLRSNIVYGNSSQMCNMPTPFEPNAEMNSHNFVAIQQRPPYDRSIGYGGGGSMNMNGMGGGRGAFTSTQLMELQNQTYIYKYLAANVAVPPHLLTPLRNNIYPHVLPPYVPSFYSSPPFKWGNPRPTFGSSNDPEPGRCRRTDGKKWRCAKDVVTNQKYCERHLNRGRQRTRKATEVQRSTSYTTSTPTMSLRTNPILTPRSVNMGASSNNPNNIHQHCRNLDLVVANSSMDVSANRSIISTRNVDGGEQDPQGVHVPVIEEQSISELGIFPSDSFIDPSQRSSFPILNNQQEHDQTQFIDWPEHLSSHSSAHWDELTSDWTSLDYSLMSSSSTLHDQRALSPLTLPQEIDPLQVGLEVNNEFDDDLIQNPTNWLAFNYENPSSPHNLSNEGRDDGAFNSETK
ncbi:growth-regulating factor 1 [Euphorbia peplus]|nr:growth-regulating factor 1 [Euphorbia peplus]